uniref:Family with sequence similarity 234 member A n=1 Tax=Malurus cyaneus samueli TaxID=2593467 RepID=A0A8C5U0A5_9PASS
VMDNKDSEAEIHPLKTEEVKVQENHEHCVERRIIKSSGLSRLSRWRTAAFFISLFLCLIIVFAFSFIIPCPERPVSERTWFQYYNDAVAYQFLAIEDVNEDKVQDVVFAFKASNGSSSFNRSCLDEGLPSPCAFIAAVSGTNGSALWESPTGEDVQWLQCGIQQLGTAEAPGCLVVGKPLSLTAIDLRTGECQQSPAALQGTGRLLSSPGGLQGGHQRDMTGWYVNNGSQQQQCPGRCNLFLPGSYLDLAYCVVCFLLANVRCCFRVGELKALIPHSVPAVMWLGSELGWCQASPMLWQSGLLPGQLWEDRGSWESKVCPTIMVGSDVSLLFLSLSEPLLGYYKPDVLAVVLESEVGPNRKKSGSGTVQWDLKLNSGSGNLGPATLSTADHRSAFLIWGDYQEPGNETRSRAPLQKLYLFHPSYTNVLLELRNSTDHIVAFTAALFERSRHACYVLLRGPQPGEAPGPVSLMKRKLKEDVSESKVIWLSPMAGDNEQHIRDRLHRMRFHSRA